MSVPGRVLHTFISKKIFRNARIIRFHSMKINILFDSWLSSAIKRNAKENLFYEGKKKICLSSVFYHLWNELFQPPAVHSSCGQFSVCLSYSIYLMDPPSRALTPPAKIQ